MRARWLSIALLTIASSLASSLFLVSFSQAAERRGRERILLDAGWRFHQGDPEGAAGIAVGKWQWKPAERRPIAELEANRPASGETGWKDVGPGEDVFHASPGFAWFRTTLSSQPTAPLLAFDSVDDNGTVFLNGKRLVHHEGWNEPFEVRLDGAWSASGPNSLLVLVENTAGPGGIGPASLVNPQHDAARGPASTDYSDSGWRSVHLPHDFVVEGGFDPKADLGHGFRPAGVGWYRRTFTLPASDRGRRLWIDFDGVYRNSDVWLNGHLLGNHKSGYTGFRYDITGQVRFDAPNTLSVRADARAFEGWWYEGGGIYRHVWLNKADPVHVVPDSLFVQPELPENGPAPVRTTLTVTNQGNSEAQVTVVGEAEGPDGKAAGRTRAEVTISAGNTADVPLRFSIDRPHPWSIRHPDLYTFAVRLEQRGHELDRVETTFGLRRIRFDKDRGFFLNGQPVKIQGTCNHQDFAGVGIALPDSLQEYRIRKLQEIGCNAYRCSHNPPTPELLDACDRLGMLVMDENRHLGDTYRDHTPAGTPYSDLTDLADLIRRDRNHPSVVMWSMCNEEGLQGSDEGAHIFEAMKAVVHRLDPSRPVTCAMNGGWGRGISLVEDLQGCNYNPGGYDGFHRAHPEIPMYGSEVGSTVSTRGIYANDPARGYVSAYDLNAPSWAQTAEVTWRSIAERPFVAGGFVWTGFDYRGEPTPYGWPCVNSHFGLIDTCGFLKDNAYYYRAWWTEKPLVHLLPHWNWDAAAKPEIAVWCYANCERVELRLNGQSLGSQPMPRYGHLEWKVPYRPGRLEAIGYSNGLEVARDVVETTGPPAAVRLHADRSRLSADGEDIVPVEVAIVDAQGRIVPTASDEVRFEVRGSGSVAGVGNGDPSSHEADVSDRRHAFNGRCMVLVRAGERPGRLTVWARAGGLKQASLDFDARH